MRPQVGQSVDSGGQRRLLSRYSARHCQITSIQEGWCSFQSAHSPSMTDVRQIPRGAERDNRVVLHSRFAELSEAECVRPRYPCEWRGVRHGDTPRARSRAPKQSTRSVDAASEFVRRLVERVGLFRIEDGVPRVIRGQRGQ